MSFVPDPMVLAEYRECVPRLITASVDGGLFIEHRRLEDCEIISVIEAKSRKSVHQLRITQPAVRITWSPTGNSLAYFSSAKGTSLRRLFWWNLRENWHREIAVPPSLAQPIIRWSPDGRYFAFTTEKGDLIVTNSSSEYLVLSRHVVSFDWSSDGLAIAALVPEAEDGGCIQLIDPMNGKVLNEFKAQTRGEPQELAWYGSRRLLILYHRSPPGGLRQYMLEAFQPDTGRGELLTTSTTNMREVMWLPHDSGVLWHQQDRAGVHRIWYQARGEVEARRLNTKGAYHVRAISSDGKEVSVASYAQDSHRLLRIPIIGGDLVVIAEHRGANRPDIVHETRLVDSSGAKIPILVSRVTGRNRLDAVIIRMHAGTALSLAGDRWAEMQLYLQHGVHFIHVENRGGDVVSDLKAACDYAHRELGVPRDRIVLLGGSTGGAIVLETLLRYPDCAGIVALIGTTAPSNISQGAAVLHHMRVLAFHGENDLKIHPDDARHAIEVIFGADALRSPRGQWSVLPGEGHWLQRDESIAYIHTRILAQLNRIDSRYFNKHGVGENELP